MIESAAVMFIFGFVVGFAIGWGVGPFFPP